jgi:hypothetical protein
MKPTLELIHTLYAAQLDDSEALFNLSIIAADSKYNESTLIAFKSYANRLANVIESRHQLIMMLSEGEKQ